MPELTPAAKVAALRVLSDRVGAEYTAARREAEQAFKEMRTTLGVKSLDVLMPSGESAGSLSITGPKRTITWDEPALVDLVERVAPTELVEEIAPAALTDRDLLAVLKETRPDLIRRTVQPAHRKNLAELLSADGTLTDSTTGEIVKVADVKITPPTGSFTFAPGDRAEEAVLEAWHAGELAGVGSSLVPALEHDQPEPVTAASEAGPPPSDITPQKGDVS
ncbi:hypothetical protein Q7689_01050 [Nocardiopsis tropica]|uniref:hypothetical protein n=1 Tax=Nocardiopsis tropica TaxID=109330 RepID=UPI002E8C75A5|nr:hypothetical protein [Nocardiopsis tropica]